MCHATQTDHSVHTPEIIAHRGASRECLENTLSAFDRALEQNADGIELDAHATSDGVVVVHHDFFLRDSTSDRKITIADTSYADLSTVRLLNFEPIPTLDTVLARYATRLTVYVEVKGIGIERAVVDCLDRHPKTRTAVHAFDHRIPQAIARLFPGVQTGILSASYVIDLAHMIQSGGAADLWQQTSMIDVTLIQTAQQNGARVIAWTENDFAHAHALSALGIDALCTDIPGAMRGSFATPR